MHAILQEAWNGATASAPQHWESLSSTQEALQVVEFVADAMADQGYPKKDVFGMRLALEEAVINAIKHGNQGDPSKLVEVRYEVNAERALAEVQDQGEGFDPQQVPDPRTPENLEWAGGRGLLLMRSYLTWVRYNERGNGVTLCQYRSVPEGRAGNGRA